MWASTYRQIFYCLRPYGAPWGSHQAMKDSVKKVLNVVEGIYIDHERKRFEHVLDTLRSRL